MLKTWLALNGRCGFFPSRTVPRCPRPQIMRLDSSLKVRSPSHLWQFFTYAFRSGPNSQFWQVVINFLHSFLIFLYNIICYCFNVKINFKIPEYQCSLAVASCSMNTVLPMFRSSFPFLFLTPGWPLQFFPCIGRGAVRVLLKLNSLPAFENYFWC